MKFREFFNEEKTKKIDFFKFTWDERYQGIDRSQTRWVAISKGDMKEVEKWFKNNFTDFTNFEKSSKKEFDRADEEKCYVNTKALGKGFKPLNKKEGLASIAKAN